MSREPKRFFVMTRAYTHWRAEVENNEQLFTEKKALDIAAKLKKTENGKPTKLAIAVIELPRGVVGTDG